MRTDNAARLATALTILSSNVFQRYDDLCYAANDVPASDLGLWDEPEVSALLAKEGDTQSIFDSVRITQIEAFTLQVLVTSIDAPEKFMAAFREVLPTPALQSDTQDDFRTGPYAFNNLLQEAFEAGILPVDPREMNLMLPCPIPAPEYEPSAGGEAEYSP